jgi:hypothetical protein
MRIPLVRMGMSELAPTRVESTRVGSVVDAGRPSRAPHGRSPAGGWRDPVVLIGGFGWAAVPVAAAAGLIGAIAARAWMRLISTDPEFTWNGSVFIAIGFGIFATAQAIATRARSGRPWVRRVARGFGLVAMLPLFVGAGAFMAPTVLLGGLAVWHPGWPRAVRALLALGVLANVVLVVVTIVDDFGASPRSLAGIVGLILVYAGIVWATAGTFAPAG